MPRPLAVGVDLGGTKCLALALGAGGEVVGEHRLATPRGNQAVLEVLGDAAEAVGGCDGVPVGIGAPGLVDDEGVLYAGANLPDVRMLPIGTALAERLRTTVVVENDASCAAWGEFRAGAARGTRVSVVVTQGTGVGGGIIIDEKLFRGAHGFGGEIGHMVVDPSGPQCPCGKRGCWERFASGSGLARLAREAAEAGTAPRILHLAGGELGAIRGEHVTAAGAEGDAGALAVLERFGWWVALGLANLAELLDPERFVLGGGLIEAGDLILAPTRAAVAELVQFSTRRPAIEVVAAELGEQAGAIGAAFLAADAVASAG